MLPIRHYALKNKQLGFAFALAVMVALTSVLTIFLALLSQQHKAQERKKESRQVLQVAKQALLANAFDRYALSDANWRANDDFGALPCPDTNNDSSDDLMVDCGDATSSNNRQALRLGRLPQRMLGLQNLRDAEGELLWYALSGNFKRNNSITLGAAGYASMLNSETQTSLQLLNADATVNQSDVVAVILAPGRAITRQDNLSQVHQDDRTPCASDNAGAVCNAANYLDIFNQVDNANMGSASIKNFIVAAQDTASSTKINDQIIAITAAEWRRAAETRLARLLARCVMENRLVTTVYAVSVANSASSQSQAWPQTANQRIGRVPTLGNGSAVCNSIMQTTNYQTNFWPNWRGNVFMALAQSNTNPLTIIDDTGADKVTEVAMAFIFSGPAVSNQTRTNRTNIANFLESTGDSGGSPIAAGSNQYEKIRWVKPENRQSISFNDRICYITVQDAASGISNCASGAAAPELCGKAIQCLD